MNKCLPLFLCVVALTLAASAWAQSTKSGNWPTTEWVVMERQGGELFDYGLAGVLADWVASKYIPPLGERADIAEKHQRTLEAASIWYRSHGFPAPFQLTEDGDLQVDRGEAYLAGLKHDTSDNGSSHSAIGEMKLTTHAEFLSADTPRWELMEASAVHELYHGIQKSISPTLLAWGESEPTELPQCPGDANSDWLSEGTAAMVQIRWLEGKHGVSWEHPFKGSRRAAWVRVFDQPLHKGAIPFEHQLSAERFQASGVETVSWACDYGTWYFWYAVGDMIGRNDREKVAYTEFLFSQTKPWNDGGIANADAGLKAAAAAYDAIGPYRGGLHDLYPQFVAQYLTEDRFYEKLEKVDLGTPGLFETTSSLSGGPLEPLATRAWRFRIQLPENADATRYSVRFTLDAAGGTDRDDLHLIVDDKVIAPPAVSTEPYSTVKRATRATRAADGVGEYLVRIANVAEDASKTEDAEFSLLVEVDGFYGYEVGSPTAGELGAISGELAPGFSVRGPGPWTCNGNDKSRAVFDLVTPDELGRDVDRLLPGLVSSTTNNLDNVAIMLKRMENAGVSTGGMTQEQLALIRQKAEGALAAARPMIQPKAAAAADRARSGRASTIAATFVGQNGGAECQVILGATLAGREGGAQILHRSINEDVAGQGPAAAFDVGVYSAEKLQAMRTLRIGTDRVDGWQACSMNDTEREEARQRAATGNCPVVICTPGRLTLEAAEQGRIAGSFQFEVVHWGERGSGQCRKLLGRDNVTGHFNVHSTDDGKDDNSLGGLGSGSLITPGAPIL